MTVKITTPGESKDSVDTTERTVSRMVMEFGPKLHAVVGKWICDHDASRAAVNAAIAVVGGELAYALATYVAAGQLKDEEASELIEATVHSMQVNYDRIVPDLRKEFRDWTKRKAH